MKTLISVITVCLNAEKDIEFTINSVLEQDFTGYEFLIQDGGSDDHTIGIAERYRELFKDKNIPFRIISEKDEGIYDAMNKAAGYADGEWVIYINAGDALFDKNVLRNLSLELSDRYDVLYGDAVMMDNGMYRMLRAGEAERLRNTNPICHQASITRTGIVRKYSFDCRYKIAADFDLFVKLYLKDADRVKKLDLVFCIFRLGGISNSNIRQREKEFYASRKQNGMKRMLFPRLLIMEVVAFNMFRDFCRKVMGQKYYSKSRGWFSDRHEAVKADV